jgi:hypothetical protein
MTVVSAGQLESLHLAHETSLVKAALLYADRVTLVSPKLELYETALNFGEGDRAQRLRRTLEIFDASDRGSSVAAAYRRLKARPRSDLSGIERRRLAMLEDALEHANAGGVDEGRRLLENAGGAELVRAREAGVLDVHPLGLRSFVEPDAFDVVTDELLGALADSVADGATTYPLFDDGAGGMLAELVEDGVVAGGPNPRAAESGLAGRLIDGLDAFPRADMDVVLDVRERLRGPLLHFRGKLAQARTEFAAMPWNDRFDAEVDSYYRREVAPALAALDDALEELGARETLLRVSSNPTTLAAIGTLGIAAAASVGLADLPALVYGAVGTPLIGAAAGEARERSRVERIAAGHSFYFLYQANKLLGA